MARVILFLYVFALHHQKLNIRMLAMLFLKNYGNPNANTRFLCFYWTVLLTPHKSVYVVHILVYTFLVKKVAFLVL